LTSKQPCVRVKFCYRGYYVLASKSVHRWCSPRISESYEIAHKLQIRFIITPEEQRAEFLTTVIRWTIEGNVRLQFDIQITLYLSESIEDGVPESIRSKTDLKSIISEITSNCSLTSSLWYTVVRNLKLIVF
jgi:hypothetical protein